ncbi:hypothetical protein [Streptomyces sp. ISL-36]|uniref:hypothetical protein n=1 Tax=Streptomyces sp. ISL-36 TaxID=2819182 RepID=UPI0027E418F0|nr:hypothetical protein [Streptomyces sp. ISL-36]
MTAGLACLVVSGAAVGCAGGAPDTPAKELSAERMLDDANDTMSALTSVTAMCAPPRPPVAALPAV